MNFVVRLLISALVAFGLSYILPGISFDSFTDALIVALVLALLNTIVKPILIIFTFPITIITLGLFLLVINALIILMADKLVNGFDVAGFWSALLFSILLSIITSLINASDKKSDS
ncbi:phage holin family protein [Flavihumibacter solisilvae]|uniref:Membrane protein n=1 Tax=Flavihumibacter solisilvae TaxID=1349421 RepID=A0A0C1IQH3_9BACT|nr:phage holin family protein [Flavihumibacter solisilvae]KIC96450.1 membrane protein [Flavihumibacter solisilvae]